MTKIIIDTNVIVSALIKQDTPPDQILSVHLWKYELCLSEIIMNEYREVLKRPKFQSFQNFTTKANLLLFVLERVGVFYAPKENINAIADEADNRFLELAITAEADYLITGNTNDFTFSEFGKTKIVTPSEFIKLTDL